VLSEKDEKEHDKPIYFARRQLVEPCKKELCYNRKRSIRNDIFSPKI